MSISSRKFRPFILELNPLLIIQLNTKLTVNILIYMQCASRVWLPTIFIIY